MELRDYIQVYDYTLPNTVCKNVIRLFGSQIHEEVDQKGLPKFRQFNITQAIDDNEHNLNVSPWSEWGLIQNALIESSHYYVQKYMEDVDCKPYFPIKSALEQFRVKKYEKGTDDRFDKHVDVGDHASARRFLSMFWYLNDVEEGGETVFENGPTIKPKEGRLVMFPPLWLYPHEGKRTISNDKFIVSSYTHYV